MVAAARYADEYDGYLVGAPGFHLPNAAVASIYGAHALQDCQALWRRAFLPERFRVGRQAGAGHNAFFGCPYPFRVEAAEPAPALAKHRS